MKVSVCIQNNSIKLLFGNPSRRGLAGEEWHSVPIDDDAVVGGVIVNESPLRTAISQIRGKCGSAFNNINLVVNGSGVLVKQITAPNLPEKKLIKLVENEFVDMQESREELIYDYMLLGKNTPDSLSLLGTAVEKSFVGAYISLFSELGIKLASIDIALTSLIRLAECERIGKKTCIMAVFDASTLYTVLFVDGAFRFFNHTRLFQERGTLESSQEVVRQISSIIQFNASEKTGREISHIYLGGLEKSEREATAAADGAVSAPLSELIKTNLEVEAAEFPPFDEITLSANCRRRAFPLGEYALCAGNLLGM